MPDVVDQGDPCPVCKKRAICDGVATKGLEGVANGVEVGEDIAYIGAIG